MYGNREAESDPQLDEHKYVGGHRFARTAKVSAIGSGKLLYYSVKCLNCGITGKREYLQSPVERSEEYADDRYASCEMAYHLEHIRKTALSFNRKLSRKQMDEISGYVIENTGVNKRECITAMLNEMLK